MPGGHLFGEVQQWSGDGRVPFYEVPVVSGEPQEPSHLFQVSGQGPVPYFFDLGIFHFQLVVFDMHPKEVNVQLFKFTLVNVEVEVVLLEDGEHFIDYLSVVF